MNRHPECTCSWSPCHHSNYGVQDSLEADNKRLKAENERLEREAKNDLIAYKAAIERQNELLAELAGLRTGYQAYERVNAELKAEVNKIDSDRKACWAEFKVQGRYIDQLKDENEALRTALRPLLTHWDDVKPGESMNVDRARSAMRWGECP